MAKIITAFILIFTITECWGQNVTITQGVLLGTEKLDRNGNTFFSFQSIPYAQPPIGDLRFKAPQAPEEWDEPRNATEDLPMCYQEDEDGNGIGDEDCLYLDVYTPELPGDEDITLRDVMVFIHGGGFTENSGSEDLYSPEYLMTNDIVLVTVNYRLGIFGAFNIDGESEYPGNLHLKDQVFALRWVRDNIELFGGNPESVTIFGESAGAASVHFHVLSPMSAGLFHKAILESGTALGPWVVGVENSGTQLAEVLEIEADDVSAIMLDLQERSSDEILVAGQTLTQNLGMTWGSIGYPIVEQEYDNIEAFLTQDVLTIIRSGDYNHVPMIIGYNDAEGIGYFSSFTGINSLIPSDLNAENDADIESEIVTNIQEFYFGDDEVPSSAANASVDLQQVLINLYTDSCFSYPAYRSALEHLNTASESIYFYRFSADTQLNVYKLRSETLRDFAGATHADELGYLFKTFYHDELIETMEEGGVEDLAITRLGTLWTNFAKFGDPTPDDFEDFEWLPITADEFNYIDFGTSDTTTNVDPDAERLQFWADLYSSGTVSQPSFMVVLSILLMLLMNFFRI